MTASPNESSPLSGVGAGPSAPNQDPTGPEPLPFRSARQMRIDRPLDLPTDTPSPRLAQGLTSFGELGRALEKRSREWSTILRQLEGHHLHLTAIGQEQDATYRQLERAVPVLQASFRALRTAVEARQAGDVAANVDEAHTVNLRALEELEKLAGTLNAQAMWFRSAWEQYARAAEIAQRMRGEIDGMPA